jgi:hypothetical protein
MMTSLLKLLPQMLRHVGDSAEARQQAAFAAWTAVVGSQVRRVTEPLRIERKTLIVAVTDHTWRTQLDRIKGQALFRLNSLLGAPVITAIEFVINPDSIRTAEATADNFHFVAPEKAAMPLRDDADRISNPELRDAFLRAAGKCLERREK